MHRPLYGGAANLSANRRQAILRVAGVGTFAVADGQAVSIDPDPGVEEASVSLWLHGTVAALLLAQRGEFALHASVVDIDGVGVAVAGAQGAGKTTTALRLTQLGHRLVADDVSPVAVGEAVTVNPYTRPVHVSAATAENLGLDVSEAMPIVPAHAKLALPVVPGEPVALGAVAVVKPSEKAGAIVTDRIRGAEAQWLICLNAYRADILRELCEGEIFTWAAKVAGTVPVHVVTRPVRAWTADTVAREVERLVATDARSAARRGRVPARD